MVKFVDPSSLAKHYAELSKFRKMSSEININISRLPKDKNLTAKELQ